MLKRIRLLGHKIASVLFGIAEFFSISYNTRMYYYNRGLKHKREYMHIKMFE